MGLIIIKSGFKEFPYEYAKNCIIQPDKIAIGERPDQVIYDNAMSIESLPHIPEGVTYDIITI